MSTSLYGSRKLYTTSYIGATGKLYNIDHEY